MFGVFCDYLPSAIRILHRRDSIHLNVDDGPLESQYGSMCYGQSNHQNARWNGKRFTIILLPLL